MYRQIYWKFTVNLFLNLFVQIKDCMPFFLWFGWVSLCLGYFKHICIMHVQSCVFDAAVIFPKSTLIEKICWLTGFSILKPIKESKIWVYVLWLCCIIFINLLIKMFWLIGNSLFYKVGVEYLLKCSTQFGLLNYIYILCYVAIVLKLCLSLKSRYIFLSVFHSLPPVQRHTTHSCWPHLLQSHTSCPPWVPHD